MKRVSSDFIPSLRHWINEQVQIITHLLHEQQEVISWIFYTKVDGLWFLCLPTSFPWQRRSPEFRSWAKSISISITIHFSSSSFSSPFISCISNSIRSVVSITQYPSTVMSDVIQEIMTPVLYELPPMLISAAFYLLISLYQLINSWILM